MNPARGFTASDLIRLPRLDAIKAHSLGQSILAAAEGQPLTESAKEARDDVEAALTALSAVLKGKLPKEEGLPSPGPKQADMALDRAWSATHDFLSAWSKLDDEPKAAIASKMRERLYPDGLKFTKIQYARQWTESHRRLELIEEGKLASDFATLGGEAFLAMLKRTHKAYGEELGITKAPPDPIEEEKVGDALEQLAHSLRAYVLHVSAMVRRDNPSQKALVDKLLAPIVSWQSPPIGKSAGPVLPGEGGEEGPEAPPSDDESCG